MSESTIVNPASSSASIAARREAIVPPEPLWLTGLRVFAKCSVLLALLAVLVQMESDFGGRKIDSIVGGLRKEVGTKIGEKSVFLESQLKESGAKNEGLEKLFGELKDMKRMLKEEFEKIHRELRKARSHEIGSEEETNLNDIRAYLKEELVLNEIGSEGETNLNDIRAYLKEELVSNEIEKESMVVKHGREPNSP